MANNTPNIHGVLQLSIPILVEYYDEIRDWKVFIDKYERVFKMCNMINNY